MSCALHVAEHRCAAAEVHYFILHYAESLVTWKVCIPWKVSTFLEGP